MGELVAPAFLAIVSWGKKSKEANKPHMKEEEMAVCDVIRDRDLEV